MKEMLRKVLSGEAALQSGEMYADGKKVTTAEHNFFDEYGIYYIGQGQDLIEHFTVADNLLAARYVHNAFSLYDSRKARLKSKAYLMSEQMQVKPDQYIWKMTPEQRKKLSLLKARIFRAKIVVFDATRDIFYGKSAEQLSEMILRMNRDGITFIILSERYSPSAEISGRVQILRQGRDLKEFSRIDNEVRKILKNQNERTEAGRSQDRKACSFTGLYDYEWESEKSIWQYLYRFRANNPEVYREYFGEQAVLPAEGISLAAGTLVVPRDSGRQLFWNMTIEDNIILTIPERISGFRLGIVRKNLAANVSRGFYTAAGVPEEIRHPAQLNAVQRKILSIYRWAAAKPARIILENPYGGMNDDEIHLLRAYLKSLHASGVRILCFARSMDEMLEDCSVILTTHDAQNAKSGTFS